MANSKRHLILLLLVLFSLLVVACAAPEASSDKVEAARLEPIAGTDLNRLLLTEKAVERLDIQTAVVRQEQMNGAERKLVPYAAVIYDVNGGVWVYTSPQPLTFVRESVTVDFIDGDVAVLLEGPPVGTDIVTVGVAELYGADTGVGQ